MKTHNDAYYVFLANNDTLVIRQSERADITPAILERFSLDFNKLTPPLSGHPLTNLYQTPKW